MKSIILQSGHQNIQSNCIVNLRGGTGAPGEKDNNVRIRDRLSQILLTKKNLDGSQAFQLQLVDSNFNCAPNAGKTDYDLFLSLHCEADVHSADGGMISPPDQSVDLAYKESKRISDAIAREYFNHAGITERPTWISDNMKFYYMWSVLSPKTPCVLLEMGVAQNAHDKVILADTDRVANAIARGICRAFEINFDSQPTEPMVTITQKELDRIRREANENLQKYQSALQINNNFSQKLTSIKNILNS